jgi:hypothetical protein
MEATEVLERARMNEDIPSDWLVLPLIRQKVLVAILGWFFGIIAGFGLFAFIASVTIPHNFVAGMGASIVTVIMLGIVLFIGAGSAWAAFVDINRLRHAENYLIVITPDEFVKQEGDKIIHVPLAYVRYVTARGAPPAPPRTPSRGSTVREIPGAGENIASLFVGRAFLPQGNRQRRKRMRTPTTLAFIDTRSNSEVVVATDSAYGDPYQIAAYLKQYAARMQQMA